MPPFMPRLTLISILFAASVIGGFAQVDPQQRADWNKPVKPFRIIGNVYYVGAKGVSSFLIITPQGSILLDGGFTETARAIEKNIATLGFRIADVKFLLSSHAHYDHCGGLAELKRASGAQMAASRADGAVLSAGQGAKAPAIPVDRYIDDGGAIQLGGVTMTAVLTPGHTKGCTTWTMPVIENGKTYKVVFFCSTSVVDKLVGNPGYPQIVSDYQKTFVKLLGMPCDVFLGPHPSFFHLDDKLAKVAPGGPNPFIDPAEMHAHIMRSEADFAEAWKLQSRDARK
jgi:metallo-beta-lactamase class B